MRTALALVIIALAALPALAPAEAHAEAFGQAKGLSFGPYEGILEPKPSPMFANSALSMTAIFTRAAAGTIVVDGITPFLDLTAPGYNKTTKMEYDGRSYFVASVAVTQPGNYTARVRVQDANGTYTNSTEFQAYPETGLRFTNLDPYQDDPTLGKPYRIDVVTMDPDGLLVVDKLTDVNITLEHWSEDHKALLTSETLPMTRTAPGTWRLEHTFDELGMVHMRFASTSGEFASTDVPILHMTVYPAQPAAAKATPFVGGLMMVSLGLAALLIRRRAH
jgi:hypothetical protein